jgi:hypothetical protein
MSDLQLELSSRESRHQALLVELLAQRMQFSDEKIVLERKHILALVIPDMEMMHRMKLADEMNACIDRFQPSHAHFVEQKRVDFGATPQEWGMDDAHYFMVPSMRMENRSTFRMPNGISMRLPDDAVDYSDEVYAAYRRRLLADIAVAHMTGRAFRPNSIPTVSEYVLEELAVELASDGRKGDLRNVAPILNTKQIQSASGIWKSFTGWLSKKKQEGKEYVATKLAPAEKEHLVTKAFKLRRELQEYADERGLNVEDLKKKLAAGGMPLPSTSTRQYMADWLTGSSKPTMDEFEDYPDSIYDLKFQDILNDKASGQPNPAAVRIEEVDDNEPIAELREPDEEEEEERETITESCPVPGQDDSMRLQLLRSMKPDDEPLSRIILPESEEADDLLAGVRQMGHTTTTTVIAAEEVKIVIERDAARSFSPTRDLRAALESQTRRGNDDDDDMLFRRRIQQVSIAEDEGDNEVIDEEEEEEGGERQFGASGASIGSAFRRLRRAIAGGETDISAGTAYAAGELEKYVLYEGPRVGSEIENWTYYQEQLVARLLDRMCKDITLDALKQSDVVVDMKESSAPAEVAAQTLQNSSPHVGHPESFHHMMKAQQLQKRKHHTGHPDSYHHIMKEHVQLTASYAEAKYEVLHYGAVRSRDDPSIYVEKLLAQINEEWLPKLAVLRRDTGKESVLSFTKVMGDHTTFMKEFVDAVLEMRAAATTPELNKLLANAIEVTQYFSELGFSALEVSKHWRTHLECTVEYLHKLVVHTPSKSFAGDAAYSAARAKCVTSGAHFGAYLDRQSRVLHAAFTKVSSSASAAAVPEPAGVSFWERFGFKLPEGSEKKPEDRDLRFMFGIYKKVFQRADKKIQEHEFQQTLKGLTASRRQAFLKSLRYVCYLRVNDNYLKKLERGSESSSELMEKVFENSSLRFRRRQSPTAAALSGTSSATASFTDALAAVEAPQAAQCHTHESRRSKYARAVRRSAAQGKEKRSGGTHHVGTHNLSRSQPVSTLHPKNRKPISNLIMTGAANVGHSQKLLQDRRVFSRMELDPDEVYLLLTTDDPVLRRRIMKRGNGKLTGSAAAAEFRSHCFVVGSSSHALDAVKQAGAMLSLDSSVVNLKAAGALANGYTWSEVAAAAANPQTQGMRVPSRDGKGSAYVVIVPMHYASE